MRFGVRIVSYKPVLIAAPRLSVDSLRSPQRAGCRHRATPINGITLSDGERRENARRPAVMSSVLATRRCRPRHTEQDDLLACCCVRKVDMASCLRTPGAGSGARVATGRRLARTA